MLVHPYSSPPYLLGIAYLFIPYITIIGSARELSSIETLQYSTLAKLLYLNIIALPVGATGVVLFPILSRIALALVITGSISLIIGSVAIGAYIRRVCFNIDNIPYVIAGLQLIINCPSDNL